MVDADGRRDQAELDLLFAIEKRMEAPAAS
jgi:hypothetical protein